MKVLVSLAALAATSLWAQSSVTTTKVATSPMSASYYTEIWGPDAALQKETYTFYHLFTVGYQITESGWAVKAVGTVESSMGEQVDNKSVPGDHYVKLYTPTVFKNDYVSVNPQLRVYAGTSDASQRKNLSAITQPRVYVTGSVGKVDLTYILLPSIYSYSKEEDNQRQWSQGHWLTVSYNTSDNSSIDSYIYPKYNYTKGEKSQYNGTNVGLGATYKVSKQIAVSGWVDSYAHRMAADKSTLVAALDVKML